MYICRLHTLSSVCTITVRRGACLLTATKEYLCTTLLGNESDRPDWSGFVSTITEWLKYKNDQRSLHAMFHVNVTLMWNFKDGSTCGQKTANCMSLFENILLTVISISFNSLETTITFRFVFINTRTALSSCQNLNWMGEKLKDRLQQCCQKHCLTENRSR